jgi:hypothetical protein
VLATIYLDCQPVLEAVEIQNVWPNLVLTPELLAGKLPLSQKVPECPLGVGRFVTHFAAKAYERREIFTITLCFHV